MSISSLVGLGSGPLVSAVRAVPWLYCLYGVVDS